jgi:hypothetical protein
MTEFYKGIADWWPVISPPSEYAEEAALYVEMIRSAAHRMDSDVDIVLLDEDRAPYLEDGAWAHEMGWVGLV